MNVILFEDDLVSQLYPVTIGRPAFQLSCGSYRLLELVRRLAAPIRAMVRPHLREVLYADVPELAPASEDDRSPARQHGPTLLVNARLVPTITALRRLETLSAAKRPMVVRSGDSVAAALVDQDHPLLAEDLDSRDLAAWLDQLQLPPSEVELPLLVYPHDLVRYHRAALAENLEDRISRGDYKEIADGVLAARSSNPPATLGEYVVVDAREGPIVLQEGATIGAHCYLGGPAYVGPRARVLEHAAIKDGVALGHTTKIGGEIEASTIEPYTNKQHHGFLGHSYLGSWVNLGAGTCNSDLKNTYGQVSMVYEGRKVATGMQFIGCIIGDYAKTAVNTSIFTGKTIGACTMVYGFVTTNVPSFVNYARSFGQVTEAPAEVMIATQARMFARRSVTQRPCDIQLLRDMHALTRHERQLAEEPLSL